MAASASAGVAGVIVAGVSGGSDGASGAGAGGVIAAAGSGGGAPGGDVATDGSPGTLTDVLAILGNHGCGLCHGAEPGQGDGGLSFDWRQKDASFQAFVGVQSAGINGSVCAGKTYVVPGSPEMSLLYDKLANPAPSCGARMPASGMLLSAAELGTVRSWISAGAQDN